MSNTLKLGAGKWATGTDTVLAFNDENNNFKPLPFDFSRASSATVVNQSGLIETVGSGEPRIDFLGNTKGALKLEPQRTNLVTYSEDFSQFTGGGSIVIESGYLAPDGTNSAYKVSGSGGALNIGLALTNSETRSIYAKTISGQGNAHLCSYFGNTNNLKTITEDWQRFKVNGTTTETGVTSFYAVDFRGSTDLNEIIIWGAQAEVGSYATSYIPTSGSAVTRVAETCNNGGNDQVINSTEGVLYAEATIENTNTFKTISRLTVTDTSTSDGLWIYARSDNKVQGVLRLAGVDQVALLSPLTYSGFVKVAFKYSLNNFSLWINGVEIQTDTSGNVFPVNTLSKMGFVLGTSTNPFYGKTKDLRVYSTALTDSELAALTS